MQESVAGPGEDEAVAYVRDGAHLVGFGAWSSADPRGEVVAFLNPFKQKFETVNVDAIGIGYNFGLHLEDQGFPVELINVGESARDSEKNANSKAQYYWGLRERFEPGDISGLTDETTISQLATIKYRHTSRGQVQIESKEDARKRGVKSPDRAEALMLAFADRTPAMLTYVREKVEHQQAVETARFNGEPTPEEPDANELMDEYNRVRDEIEGNSGRGKCPKCGERLGVEQTLNTDGKWYHRKCVRGW